MPDAAPGGEDGPEAEPSSGEADELGGSGELADEPDPGSEPEPEPVGVEPEPEPVDLQDDGDGGDTLDAEPEPEPEPEPEAQPALDGCDGLAGLVEVSDGQCAQLVVLDPGYVEVATFGLVLVLACLGALVVSGLRR
jgi:hypothetical protein